MEFFEFMRTPWNGMIDSQRSSNHWLKTAAIGLQFVLRIAMYTAYNAMYLQSVLHSCL